MTVMLRTTLILICGLTGRNLESGILVILPSMRLQMSALLPVAYLVMLLKQPVAGGCSPGFIPWLLTGAGCFTSPFPCSSFSKWGLAWWNLAAAL